MFFTSRTLKSQSDTTPCSCRKHQRGTCTSNLVMVNEYDDDMQKDILTPGSRNRNHQIGKNARNSSKTRQSNTLQSTRNHEKNGRDSIERQNYYTFLSTELTLTFPYHEAKQSEEATFLHTNIPKRKVGRNTKQNRDETTLFPAVPALVHHRRLKAKKRV